MKQTGELALVLDDTPPELDFGLTCSTSLRDG